ncbi:hypothetical protein CPU12_12720 [Malaciobacter molluscorum LMG 25693]|uniref:Rhodanese-like domain-containing protein n=1 Tax=Malaciobacter molluscorum LMG 25693 TaxID=870501 RepID=A0A2G1DER8_9BACT|nr:rhodanese-like domain-containing protein [Malaciobacter molluscorum]AXX93512.1 rhodanese-like domain-containing protein [Malaciobacter molluscorum LMG 25693]PHO16973.1 hypothetical protein CPU12_12720 [Malaciobacter molluscorum LMG 25693]
MKWLFFLLLSLSIFLNASDVKSLNITKLDKYLSLNGIVVDIRSKQIQEKTGVIPESYKLPLIKNDEKSLKIWKFKLLKILKSAKRSFLIVDEDGTNSKKLAQRLKKDGFIQAIYLKGGFDNWKNNNTK